MFHQKFGVCFILILTDSDPQWCNCIVNLRNCNVPICCSLHGVSVDVAAGGVRPERSQCFFAEPAHPE